MRYGGRNTAGPPDVGDTEFAGLIESQEFVYLGGFPANHVNKPMGDLYDDNDIMPVTGSIEKIILRSSADRIAGSISAKITKNGAKISETQLDAALDGSNANDVVKTIGKDIITFAAGDKLGVMLDSSSDWSPTTSDIKATIYYRLDS